MAICQDGRHGLYPRLPRCTTCPWAGRPGPQARRQGCRDRRPAPPVGGASQPDCPPRYAPTDRLVLATLARLLAWERWSAYLVTPATLLRWHRELVRRRWTYAHEPCVRRGLDPAVVELVLRLARENPRWVTCRSVASAPSSGR